MQKIVFACLLTAFLTNAVRAQEGPVTLSGPEVVAKSRIVSVSIFKNGLTAVKREVQVSTAGTYPLNVALEAVHGTFWVHADRPVELALKMREVETPVHSRGDLQKDLAGKKVSIWLKGFPNPLEGTVASVNSPKDGASEAPAGGPFAGFLVVKRDDGRHTYVNPADLISLSVENPAAIVKERRPVLVLTVGKADKDKADQKPAVYITYLTQGLGWAPSYLVDITDPKKMSIEMSAAIRNELANLVDADMKLVSGSASMQFGHVPSLLSPKTKWDKFFAALSTDSDSYMQRNLNRYSSNTQTNNESKLFSESLMPAPSTEGVDLHFESIGKRSLQEGETLSLTVGKGTVDYERVVEWKAATRIHNADNEAGEELWDVLYFKNPFTFPMTSGPALVTEKGQFNGQRTCYWANIGEETTLRITRSLSIRARSQEREEKAKEPEFVKIGAKDYRRVTVQGELIVRNHRKEKVKMIVNRTVLGNILSTEGEPKQRPREDDLRSINPSQDLIWTLNLAPGEEKILRYRYNFIVHDDSPSGGRLSSYSE